MLNGLKFNLVHQLFESQTQRTPDKTAVVSEHGQITYSELNQRANQLANYLNKLGVGPEVPIAICMHRSIEMVVGLLGILKAGGVYVPLDSSYPKERLAFMLEDAQAPVLLTQSTLVQKLPEHQAQVVYLDKDWGAIAQQSQETPTSCISPAHLIYIIYTSGSTGTPKGVAVEHQAVTRLVMDTNYIQIESSDVIAQVSNCSFDAATFEIWGALLNGAQLVIIDKDLALAPQAFAELLEQRQITTLFLTTALFNLLAREVPSAFHSLKHLLFGGEAVDPKWVREVLKHGQPQRLLHVYGPTENTTFTTWYLVQEIAEHATTVPIGRPISNTECYLLDETLKPVPVGAPGELYIGGIGLARGYLNRPELTAERFIPNPLSGNGEWGMGNGEKSSTPDSRLLTPLLYKTGDLARYLSDGNIEYLGRIDHQVKIRGFRIELGEIEALLRQYKAVQDCVVIVREDMPRNKRIVAYIAAAPELAPTGNELRQYVQQQLPEYMVPSAFVVLPQLPLTPNGKVDRKALPIPDVSRSELSASYVAPRTAIEEQVAAIWAAALGVEPVGVQDSFLELGGHSLQAAQVLLRVNQIFQMQLPLHTLFQAPTVAELSLVIETNRGQAMLRSLPPIQPTAKAQSLPLSFSQQQMWLLAQMEPESAYYNDPITLRLHGPLNVTALEQSLNRIIERHAIWRTSFVTLDGQPLQVIHPHLTLPLPLIDLRSLEPEQQEQEARRLATAQAKQPFNLAQAPLLRACLVRFSPTEHRLYLTLHHIIYDGISLYTVFLKELGQLYDAFCTQQPSPLPELTLQYADFAVWQRQWLDSEMLTPQKEYWKQQLANLPVLQLPADRPQPVVRSFRGARTKVALSQQLSEQLKTFSRQQEVTLFMTLMAAFQVLLYRYSGQEDLAVATVTSGRNRVEVAELIGCFVNTLVLRTDLSGAPSFQEVVQRVRRVTLEAYANQELPFEQVVQQLQPERKPGHQPLFQALFVLAPPLRDCDRNWQVDLWDIDKGTTECDLYFEADARPEGIIGRFEYSTDLFDAETIQRLIGHFQTLLEGIVANPDQPIAELPLLTPAEHHQLAQWNPTFVEPPRTACLHELFVAQVDRTPDAVAVTFQQDQLTYRELDQRANQFAHYLQTLGIEPDGLVGLCVDVSLDLAIAILGILKAGGAYVPLDPTYPQERLAYTLEDMQAAFIVTQSHLVERLPVHSAQVICLDTDWPSIAHCPSTTPVSNVTSDNLAYIIYTSGSTGKPKGVLINHFNVVRLFQATQSWFQFGTQDVWTLFHSYAFDFSVWEFWGALLYGGRLIVVPECVRRSPDTFYALLYAEQVTVLNQTPSAFRQLVRIDESLGDSQPLNLRLVIFGGEALDVPSLKSWFDRHGDQQPQLINMYGITETTVHVTYRPITVADLGESVVSPIGIPIPDLQVHILDQHLQPLPVGVPGEMYIGGAGLGRGYLNRPDLTAERFIANPFSDQPGMRLYKSGDLARRLSNGKIEYLGRIDHQVKIRGFRIELGEIETAIRQYPDTHECVVIAREDVPDDRRLVAYLTTVESGTLSVIELRQYLKQKLPQFMIPSAFVLLETLPLTPSGKLDRKALPVPEAKSHNLANYVAPRTPVEEQVAAIWSNVLGVEQIGVHDTFLDLGGHSLLAIKVVFRINNAFQIELPLHKIFEEDTIAKLAESIEKMKRQTNQFQLPTLTSAVQQMRQQTTECQLPTLTSAVQQARRMKLSALREELNREVAKRTDKQQ
jgi:amino acid adenylation domain-containing protein